MKEITPNIRIVKSKDINADSRTFIDGSARSTADLFSMKIGRGVYNPGWRWSIHAGPQTSKTSAISRRSDLRVLNILLVNDNNVEKNIEINNASQNLKTTKKYELTQNSFDKGEGLKFIENKSFDGKKITETLGPKSVSLITID